MTASHISVLLADDEEYWTELAQEYIQSHHDDITVHTVHNGDDALAYLETTGGVDCVVSDYQMPERTGLDLLVAVRDRWPDLPFILFTGRGSEDIAMRAINAGVTDYLQKQVGSTQFAILTNRIRNVVARHRAETELERATRQIEAQFELLVETVEDYAIYVLDQEGSIRTWNRGAEKIKGYTRDEIVGEHFSIFYREEDIDAGVPEQNLHEARTAGRTVDEDWRVRKDGSEFWAEVTITALEREGDLMGYVKVTRDSTQQKRVHDLLEEKEQLEGFIAAISHDLRNPLSVVGGNIRLARETGDLSRLDVAEEALERATRLLNYIRKLSEEGEHIIDLQPVDLREVAEAAWRVIETDGAALDVEENFRLTADRWRLQQVFENLFANAVEHAGTDVVVTVGSLDGGGFYVEDDGPGIPEAERARVFEMRYPGDSEGSGFGLAICKQIVEAHGWTIELTEGADGGVRFEVSGTEME